MGWDAYLSDTLQFPFTARCVAQRAISPLERGEFPHDGSLARDGKALLTETPPGEAPAL